MKVAFRVEGPPPMKDGANSMWCHQPGIDRLIALRREAVAAFAGTGTQPFDEPVRVTIEIRGVQALDRSVGDLDNFITGVLDGLQKTANGTPWSRAPRWGEVESGIRPDQIVGLSDDAFVVEVLACKVRGSAEEAVSYSVELEPVKGW